jgi:sugar lactone lactonase YvrE
MAVGLITTFMVATVAGCASAATHTPSASTPTPAPQTPLTTPTAAAAITLANCAHPVTRAALHVVHRFSFSPDDIAIDGSDRLWVSARTANQLITLSADGSALEAAAVTGGPEGVAVGGSAIYVAQQNLNAIEQITPQRRMVVTFPNRTANAGIDGISIGGTSQTLLVPDSPDGTLIEVSLVGPPNPQVMATHLGRPVSATVAPSGDIFIASESTPGLVVLTPGGSVRRIGSFTDLDEVVFYGGLLYVTELNRHDVVAVDPASGAFAVLASNLPAPQGLAVTVRGILEIVDATTDTLYSLPTCGVA